MAAADEVVAQGQSSGWLRRRHKQQNLDRLVRPPPSTFAAARTPVSTPRLTPIPRRRRHQPVRVSFERALAVMAAKEERLVEQTADSSVQDVFFVIKSPQTPSSRTPKSRTPKQSVSVSPSTFSTLSPPSAFGLGPGRATCRPNPSPTNADDGFEPVVDGFPPAVRVPRPPEQGAPRSVRPRPGRAVASNGIPLAAGAAPPDQPADPTTSEAGA
eukprot:TRINITY_DN35670_c0_g1_i1.p1 TRINITY_DN35670_c0_g1~~TRINITY_DN35670_c0_g1_i1.p1  ORF type:complete len:249 (+),score=43.52 TRINITY_DN35670_c0_g1_i1:107-748(+)